MKKPIISQILSGKLNTKNMIICVDFDGTVVRHRYPDIGPDVPGAVETLKKLVSNGHKLILYTMRSGKELEDAKGWFFDRNITLYGVNENPKQKSWTTSPKCWAELYIDDAGLGCPLILDDEVGAFKTIGYVNWKIVDEILKESGFYKNI